MSFRDSAREALYSAMNTSDGTPASARRATQLAAVAADAASDQGHVDTAAAIAEGALSNYIRPPGKYATFREDEKR